MAYGTLAGFEAWLGSKVDSADPGQYQQLTDKTGTNTESDTQGQAALDAASSLIDSYLACRYNVPLTTIPNIVVLRTYQMAAWDLAVSNGVSQDLLPRINVMRQEAMDWLKMVCDQAVSLPGIDESEPGTSGSRTQVFIENESSVI